MILIPPGEFMMGSTDAQVEEALKVAKELKADTGTTGWIENERPQHKVVISKPFSMGATEVTVGQFKKFAATGYVTEAETAEAAAKVAPPPAATPAPAAACFLAWYELRTRGPASTWANPSRRPTAASSANS